MALPRRWLAASIMATILSSCAQPAPVGSDAPTATAVDPVATPATGTSEPVRSSAPKAPLTITPAPVDRPKHPATSVTTRVSQPSFATPNLMPPCKGRDLVASTGQGFGRQPADPSSFLVAYDVTLTNHSTTPCTVSGWVGIAAFGTIPPVIVCGPGATTCAQIPLDTVTLRKQAITHLPANNPPTILLRKGESTSFTVLPESELTCFDAPYGFHLRVSGDDQPIDLVAIPTTPAGNWSRIICDKDNNFAITALGIRG